MSEETAEEEEEYWVMMGWRIEHSWRGDWAALQDPSSHRPCSLRSLESCIDAAREVAAGPMLSRHKWKMEWKWRIRNVCTQEVIPFEALGL